MSLEIILELFVFLILMKTFPQAHAEEECKYKPWSHKSLEHKILTDISQPRDLRKTTMQV